MYVVPLALCPEDSRKALVDTALGFGKTKLFQINFFKFKVFLKLTLHCLKVSECVSLIRYNSSVSYSL